MIRINFMKIGFIGLGKMGTRMVIKLQKEGHEIVAWNRSDHELKNVETIEKLVKGLDKPRVIWIMISAGEATQNVLDELSKYIEKGDAIIDGGNSYFKDTEKRYKRRYVCHNGRRDEKTNPQNESRID